MNALQNLDSDPDLFNLTTSVELLSLPSKSSSSWKMFHGSTSDFYRTQFSEAECSINLKLTSQRDNRFVFSSSRDGFFEVSADLQHQQISQVHGFLGKAANFHQTQFEFKHSKYLTPSLELLSEFCNLGVNQQTHPLKQKSLKTNQWNEESRKQSLNSLDLVELQKRQAKLLSMLKEVDQRYKMYCDQMKAVVASFETVLGEGAATVYSTPASKGMSRHFKCLRDGILDQIKDIKEAMGEKDHNEALVTEANINNNKTPRLRVLDQSLRQQKCFQQISIAERQPWRPQRGLPERSVTVLRAWLFEHFLHPYPSDVDKLILAHQAGLSRSQVSNWFINARVRLWKPMVEEMYLEETKEQQQHNIASTATTVGDGMAANDQKHMIMHSSANHQDHHNKPPTNYSQFARLDHSDSILSSIVNITGHKAADDDHTMRPAGVDLDRISTSSYSHHTAHHEAMLIPYANNDIGHENYMNGVSLTLGLQQHGNLMSQQHHSFLFAKDHVVVEDCQPVQYSV